MTHRPVSAWRTVRNSVKQHCADGRLSMAVRTVVSMTVRNDVLDEARHALWSLVTGPFGAVEVYHSTAPDATTTVVTSLEGDVQEAVAEQLATLTTLPYEIELREDDL
jgi:hypothetical protein